LRALIEGSPKTGREVAREVGLTPRACHLSLRALVKAGVAGVELRGSAHLFSVAERHPVIENCITPMLRAERLLVDGFRGALRTVFDDCGALSVMVVDYPGARRRSADGISVVAVVEAARGAEYWAPYVAGLRRAVRRYCQTRVTFKEEDIEAFRRRLPLPKGAFLVCGLDPKDVVSTGASDALDRCAEVLGFFGIDDEEAHSAER